MMRCLRAIPSFPFILYALCCRRAAALPAGWAAIRASRVAPCTAGDTCPSAHQVNRNPKEEETDNRKTQCLKVEYHWAVQRKKTDAVCFSRLQCLLDCHQGSKTGSDLLLLLLLSWHKWVNNHAEDCWNCKADSAAPALSAKPSVGKIHQRWSSYPARQSNVSSKVLTLLIPSVSTCHYCINT